VFTWVYRKEGHPFNTNIKNVGVESAFYTQEDDAAADDLITEAEGPLSDLVNIMLSAPAGAVSDPRLPSLIAHLEVRTRHLRQCYLQSAEYFMSQLVAFMSDGDFFVESLARKLRKDPIEMHAMLSEELARRGLPPVSPEMASRLLWSCFSATETEMKRELPQLAAYLRRNLIDRLPDAAKSGHIKALKRGTSPEPKVQRYKNLFYAVAEVPDISLILGDSAVIFQVEGSRSFKTFLEKDDPLVAVFLPLTPRRVLAATRSRPIPPLCNLPQVVARCALEYFIAHDDCEGNSLLKDHIGKDAYLLTESQMKEIALEAFE